MIETNESVKNLSFWTQMFKSWAKPMLPILNSKYFNDLLEMLEESYDCFDENPTLYPQFFPKQKDIFKAFTSCPYDDLKVVILGQDPYSDGEATGIAFANSFGSRSMTYSPELNYIFENVYNNNANASVTPELTNWAEQGILLLNSALTVKAGTPMSHFTTWNKFTIELFKVLSKEKSDIIYCLWGSVAQSFKPFIDLDNNVILECEHPSDAIKDNRSWKCNHFLVIDALFERKSKSINW